MTAPSLDLRLLLESPAFEVAAFALGLVIGSFANVCVHRLPLGLSVVSPPSRCPSCASLIAPYDNVPVLGWLILRGRCRSCRNPISVRYPAVELLNGLLYLGVALLYGPSLRALLFMLVCTALVVLALIDLDHRLLPDVITLPLLLVGLLAGVQAYPRIPERWLAGLGGLMAMAVVGMLSGFDPRRPDVDDDSNPGPDWSLFAMLVAFLAWQLAVTGAWRLVWRLAAAGAWPVAALGVLNHVAAAAALGYLLMATLAFIAALYFGQEALGEGDWKMVAMLGALFGWQGMLLSVFLGCLLGTLGALLMILWRFDWRVMKVPLGILLVATIGSVFGWQARLPWVFLGCLLGALVALLLIIRGRASRMKTPLGTLLAAGGLLAIFVGDPLLTWYMGFFRG